MIHMGEVHNMAVACCTEYFTKMRRNVYQTPKSFLSFIADFKTMYSIKLAVGYEWYHPELWPFWKLFLPVPFIGLPLYYMKKYHIGSPLVVLPCFLFIPIAGFYVLLEGEVYTGNRISSSSVSATIVSLCARLTTSMRCHTIEVNTFSWYKAV